MPRKAFRPRAGAGHAGEHTHRCQVGDRFRVVVPELVGFGRSPRPESGCGPDDHAAAVGACLGRVVLAGRAAAWLDDITAPVVLAVPVLDALAARHGHVRVQRWEGGHHLPLTAAARCANLLAEMARSGSPPPAATSLSR